VTGRPRRRSGRRRVAALTLALAALAASCAPHHAGLPPLDLTGGRASYLRGLAARERPAALIESDLTLWVRAHGAGRIGASGVLLLAPPDGVRMRLDSMFGTAFDLSARGDSVIAVIPSRRMAVAADAVRDTLGLAAPGMHVYRLLSAAWRPASDASWRPATDGTLEVRWAEGPDSAALSIDREGRPSHLVWTTVDGMAWTVDYLTWTTGSGVTWPESFRCQDGRGRATLTARLARVRLQSQQNPDRLAVRVPPQTEWMDWHRFRLALEDIETWIP
jgi:hypothetical protein